jgi:hypothetical protein
VISLSKTKLVVIAILVLVVGRYAVGTQGGYRDTANLMQGLSISTEVKYLVNEHWAIMGELPCEAGELDIHVSPGRGPSVLSAIDITDCGQITLLYNDESGMPGRRMVLQAEETTAAQGLELAWTCWTPDFPDIEKRISQCRYEDRQLAAISIPNVVEESPEAGSMAAGKPAAAAAQTDRACPLRRQFTGRSSPMQFKRAYRITTS